MESGIVKSTVTFKGKLPNKIKVRGEVIISDDEYQEYQFLKQENEQWQELIEMMLQGNRNREWEFRLFKKSVRKFVDEDTYKKIADEFNRVVTEYRNKKSK
jgi:predicted CopG family antitoxin